MKDLKAFEIFAPQKPKDLHVGTDAVIYTRVSSAGQEDNTSLAGQKKHCEIFAKKKGFTIVKYFGGKSESAKTDDRVEFNKMMTYVKRSKNVRYIIVYSYERFSRSGINGAQIADDLMKKYGIVTLAVTQELDPSTPAGAFQRDILFLFSQFDNALRKDKCSNGMKENLRDGYWTWKEPMGYTALNRGAKASERKFEINERGRLIEKIFKWKANEEIGNEEISRRLAKLGWKIKGKHLLSIIRNPFYCGLITSKMIAGEVWEGKHPAIVSKSLFLRANGVLIDNNTQPAHRNEHDVNLPLRNFLRCYKCDNPMTGYLMRKKNIYYYKCNTKGCCNNRNAGKLHNYFISVLEKLKFCGEDIELFRETIKCYYGVFFKEKLGEQELLSKNLKDLQKKLDTMEERFAIGDISKEIFDKVHPKYKEEFNKTQEEMRNFEFSLSNLDKCIEFITELCLNPASWWEKSTFSQKLKLQTQLFPEGIIYDRKKDTYRTSKINSFIAPIPSIARELEGNENGENDKFNIFPTRVEPEGIEPSS